MSLTGKVAIITGAARGIGKATAKELLKNGAKVCLADTDQENGSETLKEFVKEYGVAKVIFCSCDVRHHETFENVFKETKSKFGQIDILINNAGVFDCNEWENLIDINVKGTLRGTKLGLKYMGTDNNGLGGVIVNVSSVSGLYPFHEIAEYAASKHAIVGYSRSLGCDAILSKHGVRVNVICPGGVLTEMTKVATSKGLVLKNYKYLMPEDVARNILFLITDTSKNGAILQLREQEIGDYITPEIKILESALST